MAGAFVFKLFALTVRTASKPISRFVKEEVTSHPRLQPYIIKWAQTLHKIQTRIQFSNEGGNGKAFAARLSDEKALQLAEDFIGEAFIYSVGAAFVLIEVVRSSREKDEKAAKDAAEKQKQQQERAAERQELLTGIQQQQHQLIAVQQRMDQLEQQLQCCLQNTSNNNTDNNKRLWRGFSLP
jgi:Na+-transporting methylmalonyl-CoA/oxaloacetate decarboxylase gamma subunit